MGSRSRGVGAVLLACVLAGIAGSAFAVPRRDKEEKLLARLEREQRPVKKAKLEVRLGRVRLLQAIEAYDQGDFERCQQLLRAYMDRMNRAWEHLQASGRQAWRKPDGFKQLDIGLRENGRLLEDLKHRLPFEQRGAVERIEKEAEDLRSAVLRELFPQRPPKAGKNFLGRDGQNFSPGMAEGWNP